MIDVGDARKALREANRLLREWMANDCKGPSPRAAVVAKLQEHRKWALVFWPKRLANFEELLADLKRRRPTS